MSKKIKIRNRFIGEDEPIFLTAEIGCSQGNNLELAKMLIRGAKEAGCDGADMFVVSAKDFLYTDYKGWKTEEERDYGLTKAEWAQLFKFADEIGIILYLTPLDPASVDMAIELGAPMLNINSDDLNNPLHLRQVASKGVPVTMHDINATLGEVEGAICTLIDAGCKDIILLHSTQETGDPNALFQTANLNVMHTYRQAFSSRGILTGCVEHTTSLILIYAVAALKPVLISKHLVHKHAEGVADNALSFDVSEMKEIVKNVRYVESALGSGTNILVCNQNGHQPEWDIERRKVIVARRDIKKGRVIDWNDLAVKRPGIMGGLSPWYVDVLYGAKANLDLKMDTVLNLNMFEEFKNTSYKHYNLEKCFFHRE